MDEFFMKPQARQNFPEKVTVKLRGSPYQFPEVLLPTVW
jgi:hypothetical protein